MPTLASAFISNIKCSSEKELVVRAKLIDWKGEKSKFTEVKSISEEEKVRLDVEVEKFVSARDAVNTFLRIEVLTPVEGAKKEEEEKDSKEEEKTHRVLASTSIDLGTAAVNPEKQLDRDFSIRLCSSGEKENAVEMTLSLSLSDEVTSSLRRTRLFELQSLVLENVPETFGKEHSRCCTRGGDFSTFRVGRDTA